MSNWKLLQQLGSAFFSGYFLGLLTVIIVVMMNMKVPQ